MPAPRSAPLTLVLLVALVACGGRGDGRAGERSQPPPITAPISQYEVPPEWQAWIRDHYTSDRRVAAQPAEVATPPADRMRRRIPDSSPFDGPPPALVSTSSLPGGGPLVERAEAAVNEGDFDRGVELIKEAMDQDPDDLQALFVLAWAQGDQGLAAASLLSWQRLLDAQPGLAEGWLGVGTLLVDMGRADDAIGPLDRALALDPSWEVWLERGIALCRAGRFDEAEWDLWRAAQLGPADPNAWYDLAWVYAQRNDAAAAVEALRFAARDPGLFAVRHCREVLAGEPVFQPLVGDRVYEAYLDRLPHRCIAQERRNVLVDGARGR